MTLATESLGKYAPDFELPGIDNKVYHLGRYRQQYKAIAVFFLSDRVSEKIKSLKRIKQIKAQFAEANFMVIAIDSHGSDNNLQESVARMKSFADSNQLDFPYLRDTTQDVAKSFAVEAPSEVFLLDNDTVIRYAGKIDDDTITNNYLKNNIINLLIEE